MFDISAVDTPLWHITSRQHWNWGGEGEIRHWWGIFYSVDGHLWWSPHGVHMEFKSQVTLFAPGCVARIPTFIWWFSYGVDTSWRSLLTWAAKHSSPCHPHGLNGFTLSFESCSLKNFNGHLWWSPHGVHMELIVPTHQKAPLPARKPRKSRSPCRSKSRLPAQTRRAMWLGLHKQKLWRRYVPPRKTCTRRLSQ